MTSKQTYDHTDPDSPILGPIGLAALLAISPTTIWNLRYRNPDRLPPACTTKPLRWRRTVVMDWLSTQERAETERAARYANSVAPSGRPRR